MVWRDPLDCCRSALRAGKQNRFFAQPGMATRILLGSEALALGVEWLRRRQRRVHEVVFSDLVAQPEVALRDICRFLGINFEPEMLDLHQADLSSLPAGEHHSGVRSGVIAPPRSADDPLPPEFVAKAQRYAALWRERFPELGFARALPAVEGVKAPGLEERLADAANLGYWGARDYAKRRVLRHIPLKWWARVRHGSAPATLSAQLAQ